jgi:hypothetical protein
MGRAQLDARTRPTDPVYLLHQPDRLIDVLDNVLQEHLIEAAVLERIGIHVEVVHDVGGSV